MKIKLLNRAPFCASKKLKTLVDLNILICTELLFQLNIYEAKKFHSPHSSLELQSTSQRQHSIDVVSCGTAPPKLKLRNQVSLH